MFGVQQLPDPLAQQTGIGQLVKGGRIEKSQKKGRVSMYAQRVVKEAFAQTLVSLPQLWATLTQYFEACNKPFSVMNVSWTLTVVM